MLQLYLDDERLKKRKKMFTPEEYCPCSVDANADLL
jgi:hypothetical protein